MCYQSALPPTVEECCGVLADSDCALCRRAGRTLLTAHRAMMRGDRKSLSACVARLDRAEQAVPLAAVECGLSRWVYLASEYAHGWSAEI
jgi:hypothetical protein